MVQGAARAHEVATPLAVALAAGQLDRADLLAVIDAREIEAEGNIPTLAAWRAWLLGGAGGIAVAAGRLLGAPQPETLRPLGAACGVATLLRGMAATARQGRSLLPADMQISLEEQAQTPPGPALREIRRQLAAEAQTWLTIGPKTPLPRSAIAAVLPAVLARRDLRRNQPPQARGLGDRLAVMWAAMRGRA